MTRRSKAGLTSKFTAFHFLGWGNGDFVDCNMLQLAGCGGSGREIFVVCQPIRARKRQMSVAERGRQVI